MTLAGRLMSTRLRRAARENSASALNAQARGDGAAEVFAFF